MYSWTLGDYKDFEVDPERLLLGVKSLLPRWMNGIPDAQFINIFRLGLSVLESDSDPSGDLIFCETGVGASTLALVGAIAFSKRHDIQVYNWDTNGRKQSEIRTVIAETLCNFSEFDLRQFITITGDAKSEICGLGVLGELNKKILFGFFDSTHTSEQLGAEVAIALKHFISGSICCIDDQLLAIEKENFHLGNLSRKKLGLNPFSENLTEKYISKVTLGELTKRIVGAAFNFEQVSWLLDEETTAQLDKTFFSYFSLDRAQMHEAGAERGSTSHHRSLALRLLDAKGLEYTAK